MPTVTIFQPADGVSVPAGPVQVTGRATDKAGAEPVFVDSVTVQVDGNPPVEATLTRRPGKTETVVDFAATVQVTGAEGRHAITAVATNDNNISRSAHVTVFLGPTFAVDAPAIVVDIETPSPVDPHDPAVTSALGRLQQGLADLSGLLAGVGKTIIGPNLVTDGSSGLPILRLGLWVEDLGFPADPPAPPAFPLPRLSDTAAAAGFALVPLLPRPHRTGFTDMPFAVSIATSALQAFVAAALVARPDGNVDSITVSVSPPNTVTTTYQGHVALGLVPYTITVDETLGTQFDPALGQSVPMVTASHSSTVGDVPDWLLGSLLPILDLGLLVVWQDVSRSADSTGGVAAPIVADLPARIPFHPGDLPGGGTDSPFPVLVADWANLGVTADGILGGADATIQGRDQSMVGIAIGGPDFVRVPPGEFQANEVYRIGLQNLAPDGGVVTWQLTSPFDHSTSTGALELGPFAQIAYLDIDFPMPLHASPGDYHYQLSVSAQETGPDGAGTLAAAASRQITVRNPSQVQPHHTGQPAI
jgi:Big-like domain-containing protein